MEIEDDTWLLKEAKRLVEENLWRARNFLITAKSLCPKSLKLRIIEFKLESQERNIQLCSKLLKEMFDDFSENSDFWAEFIPLVKDVQKDEPNKQKSIFKNLPESIQKEMVINCAKHHTLFIEQSNLFLLLIEMFPETTVNHGISLADRLVQKEKDINDSLPSIACNQYRKLLVCRLLPILSRSKAVNVSNKQFYKWMQKAIEYYTCSFTNSDSNLSNKDAWKELTKLRLLIGQKCDWKTPSKKSINLKDSLDFLRDLYNQECSDEEESARNRKLVFYSSIALLFEAASKYMLTLDPAMYIDHASDVLPYIIIPKAIRPAVHKPADLSRNAKLNEYFFVAIECFNLLNTDDGFEIDFSFLTRRWKVDKWIWYQLFLVNLAVYEEDSILSFSRISDLEMRLKDENCTLLYRQRIYCHLAMINFSALTKENARTACDHACHFISMFSKRDISSGRQVFCSLESPESKSQLYPLSLACILPVFIDYFLTSILQSAKFESGDDNTLGHVIVLAQYDWPKRKSMFHDVIKRMCSKKTMNLSMFISHVTNSDLLEELAYIHNKKLCHFVISENQNNHTTPSQIISLLVNSVNHPNQPTTEVLVDYLTTFRELILKTLCTDEILFDDAKEGLSKNYRIRKRYNR